MTTVQQALIALGEAIAAECPSLTPETVEVTLPMAAYCQLWQAVALHRQLWGNAMPEIKTWTGPTLQFATPCGWITVRRAGTSRRRAP